MPVRPTRPSRRQRAIRKRLLRALSLLAVTALALVLTTEQAVAQGATLPPLTLAPLKGLVAWATGGDPSWNGLPKQKSGSAAGRGHSVPASDTRAGGGSGHPAGKGKGELDASKPLTRNVKTGPSASGHEGFNPRTSKRDAAKSTANSDYYENADGSFSRKVSQSKTNYRDRSGAWQPVDTGVDKGGDGRWHQKANSLTVDFAAQAADGALASLGVDEGHSLSYALKGAAPVQGTAAGSAVTYAGVLPDTDLQLAPMASGVKESVILHSAKAGNSWVFPLDLKGLTPKINAAGGVDLQDASGKPMETIPAAYAFDSKISPVSGERGTTHAVKYELTTDGGKPALRMTLDEAWLHDAARVFPVTVDPSVWDRPNTTYVETGSDIPQVDHSMEQTLKIGSWDSGPHSARAFEQDWYRAFDGSGVSLVSANLHLYDIWAATCTPQSISVAQVTQAWSPTTTVSYPGPSIGGQIGTVTPSVPHACANTTGSPTGGDWVTVPLDKNAIQNWANGSMTDNGLAIYASTTDNLHWKQFGSMAFPGIEPYIVYDYTGNIAPQVEAVFPQSGGATDTLTPELQAFADDDHAPNASVQYRFFVYDTNSTQVVDSGLTGSGSWTVPAGKLKWGQSYYWTAQAYDGALYSESYPWSVLSVQVPQPALTSSLSQNSDARGFDPAIGNFTKSVTDAEVGGAGPSLDVVRSYNSRDSRTTGAFGTGWSSVFDARATERYNASGAVAAVTVTYPDGSQVGFGKNADGTFTPPSGRFATLRSVTGGYTLTDKNATVDTFTQSLGSGAYGVTSIADANARAVNFTWASGRISAMTSGVSGRALHLNWATPSGAGAAHVSSVYTDPAKPGDSATVLTWNYTYTGDQLTKLCAPTDTTSCSQYDYTAGSQFQTQVLDAGASSLWPFSETAGATMAASAVNTNEGADKATYSNVTLGQPGALAGSGATAAGFNGTSSVVEIPKSLASSSSQYTMSMWFKTTTAPGVLFSYSTQPLSSGTTLAQYTPSIYIGTDGKINAEFWNTGGVAPMVSPTAVTDGQWHQVVLSGAGSSQKLYLDGAQVGSASGMISRSSGYTSALQGHTYIGGGFLGGTWPDESHYSTSSNTGYATYFNGSIAQVAAFPKGLAGDQVTALYNAGKKTGSLLSGMTRPSGKQFASVAYDTNAARVTQVTDENGGLWKVGAPSVAGSSQVYRAAVLGSGPAGYWRLGDTAGASSAYDEVNYGLSTYNAVTLGSGGPFSDATAAKFNASSSYVQLPSTDTIATGPNSVEMWFNMPAGSTAGGVLFDYAGASLTGGSPASNSYVPALYVGSDGLLRGRFWGFGYVTTGSKVSDGKWHHVVLSAGATAETMYLDGTQVGTSAGTFTASNSQYVYVGAGEAAGWPSAPTNTLGYFPGSIAEVAFYRSQLSSAEASAHYQAGQNSSGPTPVETVTITEPSGKTLTHQYDPNAGNRQIAEVDGGGNRTTYGYDTGGFMRTVTDPNGSVTTTGHDVRGNTVSATSCQNQSAGTCSTKYFTYYPDATTAPLTTADARNDVLLTVRDGRSSSATDNTYLTSYGYDAAGNRTTVTSPAVAGFPGGRTATTTYSDGTAAYPATDSGNVPAGLPVKVTSPGGAISAIAYLHNGDIASTTMASGLKTTYTYDGLGRPTAKTVISDSYPAGLTNTYTYDGSSQVVQETSPAITDRVTGAVHTAVSSTVFDADGNVTSQTVADTTGGDAPRTQSSTYDQYDHVATRTDANGNAGYANGATTRFAYDTSGNVVQETNPAGDVTQFTYDSDGKLLTQSLLNHTGDPNNPSSPKTLVESSRAYDPAGRLASVTDAMGSTTSYTYTDDGLTATVTRTDPNGTLSYVLQSNVYDAAANLTQRTTDNGATVTQMQVDAASRTTATTVDPSGVNRTTNLSFTPDDLVATSNQHDSSGWDRTISATYDTAGRALTRTLHGDASGHPNAWWKLDQTSGSTVTDNSGTGYTTSVTGPVAWSGGGATFHAGTGEQIASNGPVLNTGSSFTVSAWANVPAGAPTGVIASQDSTQMSGFILWYNYDGHWKFGASTSDTAGWHADSVGAAGTAQTGTWTHLVGVYDASAGTISLYVNGVLAGSAPHTVVGASSGPFVIGRDQVSGAANAPLSGTVANVQAYQRALPAAETQTLYGNGRTGGTVGSSNEQTSTFGYDQRGLTTSVRDANGQRTDFVYDEAGNRTSAIAPTVSVETTGGSAVQAAPTTTSGFNTFGEEVEVLDPNGNQVRHTYDANGEETSTTDPSYTPPGSGTPITATTSQTYDVLGNVIKATRPDGKFSSYLFDQRGELAQETTPDGKKTRYTYDANGDVLSTTDASGGVRQATYDWLGRRITSSVLERFPTAQTLTSTTSYAVTAGNPYGAFVSSGTTADGRTTTYAYNRVGDMASVTDPVGNTTRYSYDFTGRKQKTTAPDGTWSQVDYNAMGLPAYGKQYDAGNTLLAQTSKVYDAVGNVLSTTDARGKTSTFTYDATGKVTGEVQPVGAGTSITTSFGYDAAGHRTRFTDGRGNSWKYTYNAWGSQETAVAPSTTAYSSAADSTTTYVYDQLGQLTRVNQPGGVVNTMSYDVSGNLVSQSGSGAEVATATRSFTYDDLGQILTAQTAAAGTAGQAGFQSATSETFGYDDRGDLLSAAGSAGNSSFAYSKDGLLTSRTDAAGTTSYGYDNAGRLSTIADPATGNTLTYGYNSLSMPVSIGYGASGQSRAFTYDSLHRLTKDTLTKGASTLASVGYGYDANGNMTSKTTTGVTGAAANTYTYDDANRLTSWNNGTTNTAYSYDASGNRTQVGSNVFTYDERDQLTSDGQHTYRYSARGTMTEDRQGGTPLVYGSDAYGQQILADQQTYNLDAAGRVITAANAVSGTRTFQYTGDTNQVASDGSNTYTWDPGSGLVGVNTPGGATSAGRLVMTDQHDDVIGQFATNSTTLTGSQTYDPLGKMTATAGLIGQLGFQSGWTDGATSKVNMGSRWYNPGNGQFLNKDTVSLNAVPTSVSANPFAYVNDNPLAGTDPSGHCSWYDVVCGVSHAAKTVSSAWNSASSYVSQKAEQAYHYVAQVVTQVVQTVQRKVNNAVHYVADVSRRVYRTTRRVYRNTVRTVRNYAKATVHVVKTAYHAAVQKVQHVAHTVGKTVSHAAAAVGHAVTATAAASARYVKDHAAAITSFVVSAAVFVGCEAAIGVATGGVGAVVGAAACGALAGEAGAAVDQAFKCHKGEAGACSVGAFGAAIAIGGIGGAIGGALGGAFGGKLAASALGKILPSFATGALEGAAMGGVTGAITGAAGYGLTCGDSCSWSGAASAGVSGAVDGAIGGAIGGGIGGALKGRGGCGVTHSFTGSTPVLMADNSVKPIDQIKIGDQVANAVPGKSGTESHTVTDVIVTTTDHDFVNVTIAPATTATTPKTTEAVTPQATTTEAAPAKSGGRWSKAALGLAASVAALTLWAGSPAQEAQAAEAPSTTAQSQPAAADTGSDAEVDAHGSTLTTTFHHPFYDQTRHAFVDAQDLHPGDVLQTPSGTATVTAVQLFHADTTTYDLTIGDLHTYFVLAGETPVLVHNCKNGDTYEAGGSVRYKGFDSLGRPTGVSASISRDMLRIKDEGQKGLGTEAGKIKPPGWRNQGNFFNEARGHLFAGRLGGKGTGSNGKRNLVTLTQDPTNTPDMANLVESPIFERVKANEIVQYDITPVYEGSNPIPIEIRMEAVGNQGFQLSAWLTNPAAAIRTGGNGVY